MTSLWSDVKFGYRMLWKRPLVTVFAVLALAMGIGANSVIFSMVNSLLLTPLPIPNYEKMMRIEERQPGESFTSGISAKNYKDLKERATSFDDVSLITVDYFNLSGYGEPVRISAYLATTEVLENIEMPAALGRMFLPEEDLAGNNHVVLLNYGFWMEQFGGDQSVIGTEILLNDEPYTIVGVVSQTMGVFDAEARIWIPLPEERFQEDRNIRRYSAFGFLKDGVSLEQARAEAAAIYQQLQEEYPEMNKDLSVQVEPMILKLVDQIQVLFYILHGAVGFLLLIACSNVASLLLAKAGARNKEIAVRSALGAGNGRILRQMLIESIMLSVLGGVCGLLITIWGIEFLKVMLPPVFSEFMTRQGIDLNLLLFTLAVSILTGVIFGIVPALQAMRFNLNDVLKDSGRSGGISVSRHHTLKSLIVGEVALSLILLIGAGLMVNSFIRMQNAMPGFRTNDLMTFHVVMPETNYNDEQRRQFFKETVQRLSAIPGVEGAAAANVVPFTWGSLISFQIDGRELPPGQNGFNAQLRNVNLDYFRVFSIPLLQGEPFSTQDEDPDARTVIVDLEFANRFFPNENPVGKYIRINDWDNAMYRVTGLVGKVKSFGFKNDYEPTVYVPYMRQTAESVSIALLFESQRGVSATAVRSVIADIDPGLPIAGLSTMDQLIDDSMMFEKFTTVLLGIMSCVALFLSAVGIYGIISYSVSQQTRDIGIRMALGAKWTDVLRMVIRQGMTLTGMGVILGLGGAFAAVRILSSQLYGVSQYDPMTFLYVVLFFTAVALCACYFPARRAAKVDPMKALRYE